MLASRLIILNIKALLPALLLGVLFISPKVQASTSTWQKGFSFVPQSSTDFSSASFHESLNQFKVTGGNYVTFIIPYSQNTIYDTNLYPSANTPSDDSLKAAVDYAHSLGLAVNLKPHLDNHDTTWRADINPSDRNAWFTNYGLILNHYGLIAQENHVEMITIGTELIHMASENLNSTNTQNWKNLIANLRSIYTGKLTYSANWDIGSWRDEVDYIGFWPELDYIGISAYYHIGSTCNDSLSDLQSAWNNINISRVKPLADKYGKPIIFTEVGYRSVDCALTHPASWSMTGPVDLQEQINGYQSLFDYWKDYPYFAGVQFWDWSTNPNAGGTSNSDFTPQGKPALNTIKSWFTSDTPPVETPPGDSKVKYLSDITWISATNGWGPVEKDMSNGETAAGDGHKLTLNGTIYDKGLGVHAMSKVTYTISGCTNFSAVVGVDDEISARGSVVFQVFSGSTKIYDSGLRWYNSANKTISLNITQVTELNLVVTDGGNGVAKDHADWANARITCTDAPPTPSPTPTPTPSPTPPPPPPVSANIEVWWPTDGSTIAGTTAFKVLLAGFALSQYQMYWQVDNGNLNPMFDSFTDTPHKEAWVDVSGWWWRNNGPYIINYVAKDSTGTIIAQKSVQIYIAR
ncbi:MAG: NPCBM/NEW2 domain-containing protein [Candidatus Doudnabacteria bacterium]|nr:NPCBM/NEW2 domain-containing protein [Candidatus Doudnabacteria bacterium]